MNEEHRRGAKEAITADLTRDQRHLPLEGSHSDEKRKSLSYQQEQGQFGDEHERDTTDQSREEEKKAGQKEQKKPSPTTKTISGSVGRDRLLDEENASLTSELQLGTTTEELPTHELMKHRGSQQMKNTNLENELDTREKKELIKDKK